jgi:hypothetical protein
MDHRDRLICALSALLRAEREAREAFESAVNAGAITPENARIMLSNPLSVATREDIELAEDFAYPWERPYPHVTRSS